MIKRRWKPPAFECGVFEGGESGRNRFARRLGRRVVPVIGTKSVRKWGAACIGAMLTFACGWLQAADANRAADAGPAAQHAEFLVAQAIAFEHGEGVTQDTGKAAQMYCEAARLGSVEAMYSLGWMYANGRGVERSDPIAGTLFAMAAFQGNEHAARMVRFTGDYQGIVPECMNPPESERTADVDRRWDYSAYLAALPTDKRNIGNLVVSLAPKYNIDPALALAIASTESNFNPAAESTKSALGVMQLIPETAERFNVRDAFDPAQNIKGGLAYLRWLLAYFQGNVALVAAGYNAGEGAVDRYRGVPPYRETRNYVDRILALFKADRHPFESHVVEPSPMLRSLRVAAQ